MKKIEEQKKNYVYFPYVEVKCTDGIVKVTETEKRVYLDAKVAYNVAESIAEDQRAVSSDVEVTSHVMRYEVIG